MKSAGPPFADQGRSVRALDIAGVRATVPFQVSFEEVAQQLAVFDRLFLEPDGSFVWTGQSADQSGWQLDGVLTDHHDHLRFVELKGWCPEQSFAQLCQVLRFSAESDRLVVQLVRQAVLLEASEFRRFAFSEARE